MEDQDRQRLAVVEQNLGALTARLNALAEGHFEIGGEGFRVGSTRLLEKLVSGDYHLHQRDAAGAESDLTGAKSIWGKPIHDTAPTGGYVLVYNASTGEIEWTASSAPGAHVLATTAGLGPVHTTSGLTARQVLRATGAAAAAFGAIQDADLPATIARDSELHTESHKDRHDPEDGADPLDCAAPAEISVVVAASEGSAHTFARADHVHAINHALTDNHLATIDGTTNAPVNLDYAKWTALGLEGRTYTQLRADINVADGADVTADNTPKVHGPAQHTEGNAWKMVYQDAAGDEVEIAVGADGTVLTGTGAASAPAFEAASGHAHANDHTRLHAITDVLDHSATNWRMFYSDGSAHIIELALGADGTFLQSSGAGTLPEFTALVDTDIPDISATYVAKALFDANTFLYAVDDNTPIVKTRAEVMALLSGQAAADFAMNTHKITGVVDPAANQDAATKKYVDDNIGGGGATVALDNLDTTAVNESIIPATDSAIDLGSATPKYWRAVFADKVWLNSTAAIDGATAGKVNLTGNLQVAGLIGVGTAPVAGTYLKIAPTGDVSEQKGIDISPTAASIGDGGHFYALTGTAVISVTAPNVGTEMTGLFFSAIKGGTGDLTEMSAIRVGVGQLGSAGTVARMHGILVDQRFDSGGTPTITDAWGVRIKNQGTDHVARAYGLMVEPMVGAGSNYSIWAGADKDGTPRLRLDDGAPADYETMLYLGADDPIALQRVTLGAADSGDAGFRCLQVPNLV